MANDGDLELWDIDIDQSSAPGHLESWTLAGYTWDPVGLVATRKAELADTNRPSVRNSGGDNDSGGSTHIFEPGMEVEPQDGGAVCVDPELLASAPVYHPQPSGNKMMVCQVVDCGVSLEGMKGYFLRHRVCEEHSKAPVLLIGGVPSRLCQQCSKFHHVSAFEANKRTCRVQLDRIRINKRIRRNRKMNAAASAAFAAAGFQDDIDAAMLGELPARPAAAFGGDGGGGGRAKRPADSSGSGEGSWLYSRKSSRHGGGGIGGARADAVGRVAGGDAAAAITAAAAAAAAAAVRAGVPSELEPLPESGASDTGSREHPRASLGVSGSMRWAPSSVPPRSPLLTAVAAAGFGEGGGGGSGSGGTAFAHSPASAVTGGSNGAGMEYGSYGDGGGVGHDHLHLHHQQRVQHQMANRVSRLDSLPVSAAEAGPSRGSIAAAAAGLTNESSLTAPLRNYQLQGGLTVLAAQQDAAAAAAVRGQGPFLHAAAMAAAGMLQGGGNGSLADAFGSGGTVQQQQQQLAAAVGQAPASRTALSVGLQPPSSGSGQDSGSGGSNGVAVAAQEITSLWSKAAALTDLADRAVAATAVDCAHVPRQRSSPPQQQQLQQQQQPTNSAAAPDSVQSPLSASALHPLLQQQLQQELLLQQQQQQKLQQQQQNQRDALSNMAPAPVAQQQQQQQQQQAAVSHTQQQQQQKLSPGASPPQQQQQGQQQQGSSWDPTAAEASAAVPVPVPIQPQAEVQLAVAAAATAGGPAALVPTAQAVAVSQLSAPSNLTGRSALGLGGLNQRSGSHCSGGGGGLHLSGGTNTLSSSKLVRMSLENDEALDDSSALLSNLIDLLHTQAAEPRDGAAADPRIPPSWAANASRLGPNTFSEPGSLGSGNGSLAAAAAAGSNGFGVSLGGSLGLAASAGGGSALAAALGGFASGADLSSAAALSRAGSGAVGSPQSAAMLAAAAAVAGAGNSRLGQSLETLGGVPGALAAAAAASGGRQNLGLLAGGIAPAAGPMAMPALGATGAHRLLEGLGPAGLAAQLQEQAQALHAPVNHPLAAAAAATNQELLLQHQLLLAQQQQQQQLQLLQHQQLLRLQQQAAQAQAQAALMPGGAAPSVPAAGLLLSRLLDADTKTHHLSTELNGYLAEKQLLRRQLLATLSTSTGQGPTDAEHLAAAAAMAAGGGTAPAALQPGGPPSLSGLGPQVMSAHLQRPLLGGLGLGAGPAGLSAAASLGLGGACAGLNAGGLGGFPGLEASSAAGVPIASEGLMADAAAGLGLCAPRLRPGGALGGSLPAVGALDIQSQMLQLRAVGSAGPMSSGLLGAGRPSAAAQLQALAEARGATASGAVAPSGCVPATATAAAGGGGGGISGASYMAPDLVTRVSLKIMNCLPDELPNDIRTRMQAFASQAPLDLVQGCLRPGCTEVVLDALHCGDEQGLISELLRGGDSEAAAAALLLALPASLHAKDIYLQVADQVVCLRAGAPPRHASWAGMGIRRGGARVAKPELAGAAAESLVLHLDSAMDMEGCVRFQVYGKHLADPGVTFLARLAGLALPVKIKPVAADSPAAADNAATVAPPTTTQPVDSSSSSTALPTTLRPMQEASAGSPCIAPASAAPSSSPSPPLTAANNASYDAYDVEIQLPYNAPPQGLLILEPRAGVLLGDWAPVLLLEDAAAAAEVEGLLRQLEPNQARRLAASLGVFLDHVERCAAVLEERAREPERRSAMEASEEERVGGVDEEDELEQAEEEELETEEGSGSRAGAESPPVSWVELYGGAHRRVVRMGHTLLAYAALRSCPALMSYIGSQLVEMGEPLGALPAAAYNGVELLGCALLSGCAPVISIAAAWAAKGGATVDWRAQVAGQPAGVNVLHLAASLPLYLAVHSLDALWSLATSAKQPAAAADAFAAAWFAEDSAAADGAGAAAADGTGFDSPSRLFRAVVDGAVVVSALSPAAVGVALSGILAADTLDRVCLVRLASAYIRHHSYTSPLDNVELPSLEGNSCAALSVGSRSGGDANRPPQASAERKVVHAGDTVQDLDQGEAAAAHLHQSRGSRTRSTGPHSGGGDNADRSGHGSVGSPPAALTSAGGWAAALAAMSGEAPAPPHQQQQQQQQQFEQEAAPPPPATASPPRMRVSVAPKALAQAAAVAASRRAGGTAAAFGRTADGSSSWLAGGGSGSGADASCVPPSGTTNATTAFFASGSLPFGSLPFGSSMASYCSQAQAQAQAGACKPLEPLVDMFRPLPESPSSGPDNSSAGASASGLLLARGTLSCGGGGGGGSAVGTLSHLEVHMRGEGEGEGLALAALQGAGLDGGDDGLPSRNPAAAAAAGPGSRLVAEAAMDACAAATVVAGGSGRPGAGETAAEVSDPDPDPGAEKLRGHMRGLARMFRRLFKKGAPEGVGPVE